MNRQLLSDSDLQLGDYRVLSTLSAAPDGRIQVSVLTAYAGRECSRMSHHAQRMARLPGRARGGGNDHPAQWQGDKNHRPAWDDGCGRISTGSGSV